MGASNIVCIPGINILSIVPDRIFTRQQKDWWEPSCCDETQVQWITDVCHYHRWCTVGSDRSFQLLFTENKDLSWRSIASHPNPVCSSLSGWLHWTLSEGLMYSFLTALAGTGSTSVSDPFLLFMERSQHPFTCLCLASGSLCWAVTSETHCPYLSQFSPVDKLTSCSTHVLMVSWVHWGFCTDCSDQHCLAGPGEGC